MSRTVRILVSTIGVALFMTFIIGLSHSISTGFAGFWGGFPFMIIAGFVIFLALLDYWQEAIKKDS
jgi:flagellar biosynthesis protein FliR